MLFFRIVWGIDVILLLIAAAFFFLGIADGSVSSFNIAIWTLLLGGLATVVFATPALIRNERRALAIGLALLPAIPAVGLAAVMAGAMLTGGRWN